MTGQHYYLTHLRPYTPRKYTGVRNTCFQVYGLGLVTIVEYYLEGQLHRTDGPAVRSLDGYEEYWVRGSQYPEDEYYNLKDVITHYE